MTRFWHLPIHRKTLKIINLQCLFFGISSNILVLHYLFSQQKFHTYSGSTLTSLALFQATVLSKFPKSKWTQQLLCCAFFFQAMVSATQSRHLSFPRTLQRSGALVPAKASWTHRPAQWVHMNWGESLLVLRSPSYWLMILNFIWWCIKVPGTPVERYSGRSFWHFKTS